MKILLSLLILLDQYNTGPFEVSFTKNAIIAMGPAKAISNKIDISISKNLFIALPASHVTLNIIFRLSTFH